MAILLDKAGTQHYANKMVLAENRKVGSKSLPSALADVDNLIEEMKGHFEAEYGSALDMKLENNENVFSVGTGNGVDKRDEVENSFTDVEIFGDSMVNLTKNKGGSLYSMSGAGNILTKTMIGENEAKYTVKEGQGLSYVTLRLGSEKILKPNTKYRVIFDVIKNSFVGYNGIAIRGASDPYFTSSTNAGAPYYAIFFNPNFDLSPGRKYVDFTTTSFSGEYTGFGLGLPSIMEQQQEVGAEFVIGNTLLLEGDYTNKPLPQYFEGLKSVGEKEDSNEIEVLSVGKNLLDVGYEYENILNGASSSKYPFTQADGFTLKSGNYRIATFIPKSMIKGNKYTLKITISNKIGSGNINFYQIKDSVYDYANKRTIKDGFIIYEFTYLDKGCRLGLYYEGGPNGAIDESVFISEMIISQQEESYEPYKQDKKQISLNEPLRGLPNGVRDSIELVNGEWKLIRRCGEVVLDGSLQYSSSNIVSFTTHHRYSMSLKTNNKPLGVIKTDLICDKFPCKNSDEEFEHCKIDDSINNLIFIYILKSRLSTQDTSGFKQWLSENPVKVIYELETPTIEDIDEVTLQCWRNGTISIDDVLPIETTHTVALNKPAQIKRNIEELTALRDRVLTLEEQYDQIALEQAHKLQLLNHSFELDYNI